VNSRVFMEYPFFLLKSESHSQADPAGGAEIAGIADVFLGVRPDRRLVGSPVSCRPRHVLRVGQVQDLREYRERQHVDLNSFMNSKSSEYVHGIRAEFFERTRRHALTGVGIPAAGAEEEVPVGVLEYRLPDRARPEVLGEGELTLALMTWVLSQFRDTEAWRWSSRGSLRSGRSAPLGVGIGVVQRAGDESSSVAGRV